jgi:predicted chitinase
MKIASRDTTNNLQSLVNIGVQPVTASMMILDKVIRGITGIPGAAIGALKPSASSDNMLGRSGTGGSATIAADGGLRQSLTAAGITDKKSQANILAQIQAESGGRGGTENLNYSATKLLEVFPKKFKDLADAQATVSQGQEAVGNRLYGSRMGNSADEGFLYRGRGLVQLTGKDNYEKFGRMLGIDLVKNPDLAANPEIAKQIAVAFFKDKQQSGTDLTDIDAVGKAVGYAGGAKETQRRANLASGYKFGGIATGPDSGYETTLHGTEAVVPLPNGNSIPVEIQGNNEQMGVMSAQLSRLDDIVRVMQTQLAVSQKLLQYAQ